MNETVEKPTSGRARRRFPRTLFAAVAVACVTVSLIGGWSLATAFESPAQREAAAKPPMPGPITAQVVAGNLDQTISTRVKIQREASESVHVPAPGANSVVTKVTVGTGSEFTAGQVLLEIDGRPLFALPGAFPFYRDLSAGDSGPDVKQLQDALNAAGYKVTADGAFGAGTIAAVTALYERAGYKVLTHAGSGEPAATVPPGSSAPAQPAAPTAPQPVVPRTEFAVISTLPAFVVTSPAVGTPISADTYVSVERGQAIARADVAASVAVKLKEGMPVALDPGDGGKISAVIASLKTQAPAPDQATGEDQSRGLASKQQPGAEQVALVIRSDSKPIPSNWLRRTVLALITARAGARDALIVPSIAVVAGGAGHPHVFKELSDGSFRSVEVTETATLDGRSAVSPIEAGALQPGDVVRIG